MAILLEIVTFLIVIIVLILVHELGHFIVAKLSGMRVDEFGIGYPPRALTLGKIGETEYTLNWLPFGGFVRIYGEDGLSEETEATPRAFSSKPRILQALVLIAGIAMNVLFAYVLITICLGVGTLQELSDPSQFSTAKDLQVAFATVAPGSPAAQAGFMAGDVITSATTTTKALGINYDGILPAGYATLIAEDASSSPITFAVIRNGKHLSITAAPKLNIIPGAAARPGLGVAIVSIGVIKTPWKQAFLQGAEVTWNEISETAVGLFDFFKSIFVLKADFSQVTGPIGIAGIVGQATSNGLTALLSLTALISINLALINLIPIPALDGGRLLFVIIEAIIRRPLNPRIAERVNMVGFALIILLMIVVSAHDIYNLFR
jgi:regulator of sigma E protease